MLVISEVSYRKKIYTSKRTKDAGKQRRSVGAWGHRVMPASPHQIGFRGGPKYHLPLQKDQVKSIYIKKI